MNKNFWARNKNPHEEIFETKPTRTKLELLG